MPGTYLNNTQQLLDPVVQTILAKMYNTTTTSNTFNDSDDSKYTVADILSSMASGEPMNTNYTSSTSLVSSGTPVVSTPLLTPTTLASLEQSFIELQSVPTTTSAQDLSRQSGFVPPLVDPVRNDYNDYGESGSDQDPEWMPSPSKRPRTSHGGVIVAAGPSAAATGVITATPRRNPGPGRKNKNEPQDEDPKRMLRRERNKLAAARCRQRRVDLTNKLITETDNLEEEQAELQNEIQTLQQQKEQLEFLLQAHKPVCPVKGLNNISVKSEPVETTDSFSQSPADLRINVKTDPEPVAKRTSAPISRPMSLALSASVTEATGVSINTPSSVLLGLESMMDGHTGLTPLVAGPTCASQVHRSSTDSSSGADNGMASPTTLVAL